MKKLIQQILKFGVVGFLCFFIDYGIMVALTELCGISSVISSGISFSVSVIVNYILSITVVFDADKEANKAKQFVIFLILSLSLIHIYMRKKKRYFPTPAPASPLQFWIPA